MTAADAPAEHHNQDSKEAEDEWTKVSKSHAVIVSAAKPFDK
jgi:hypothetical protein